MYRHSIEIHAHRGGRDLFPENSMSAFLRSADLGVTAIELDLVISSDHRIVVSHDPWMNERLCLSPDGAELKESDRECFRLYGMTYEQIRSFDCGKADPDFPSQQAIAGCKPLLSDVFDAVETACASRGRPGSMVYNLEVKSWPERVGVYHPAPDLYARFLVDGILSSGVESRIRLQSFDVHLLDALNRLFPGLSLGLLVAPGGDVEKLLAQLSCVPEFVNPFFGDVTVKLVGELHARQFRTVPWTVNEADDMLKLISMGVDGLITDYPERAAGIAGFAADGKNRV